MINDDLTEDLKQKIDILKHNVDHCVSEQNEANRHGLWPSSKSYEQLQTQLDKLELYKIFLCISEKIDRLGNDKSI